MHKLLVGAFVAAAMGSAAPVLAAAFTVSVPSELAVPGNNDFKSDLANEGLTAYASTGATITLNGNRRLRFDYMGSESGLVNSFKAGSIAPFLENDKSTWGPTLIGFDNFLAGALTGVSFNNGTVAPGDSGFAIFIPAGVREFSSNVLYFGLDDFVNNADDNHDDFIVRVTAVPEPATWGLLVIGFGMVGLTVRRRSVAVISA